MDFSVIRRKRPVKKAEPPPPPAAVPPPQTDGPPPAGPPSHPMQSFMEEMDRGPRSIDFTNTQSWRANFGDDYYHNDYYGGYRQMPMGPPLPPSSQRVRLPPPDHYRGMSHHLALPPPDYHRSYHYGPQRRDPYQMDHYGPPRHEMDYQYGPPMRDSMDYHYGPPRRDPYHMEDYYYYGGHGGGY